MATKVRVEVEVSEHDNGWLEPSVIFWPDGRKWKVDRVVYQSVSCDNEYEGIRYTVSDGLTGGVEGEEIHYLRRDRKPL